MVNHTIYLSYPYHALTNIKIAYHSRDRQHGTVYLAILNHWRPSNFLNLKLQSTFYQIGMTMFIQANSKVPFFLFTLPHPFFLTSQKKEKRQHVFALFVCCFLFFFSWRHLFKLMSYHWLVFISAWYCLFTCRCMCW